MSCRHLIPVKVMGTWITCIEWQGKLAVSKDTWPKIKSYYKLRTWLVLYDPCWSYNMSTNVTFLVQKWKDALTFLLLPGFKEEGTCSWSCQYSLLALAPRCPLICTCVCADRGAAALLWRLLSSCAAIQKVCNWQKKEDHSMVNVGAWVHLAMATSYFSATDSEQL